MAGSGHSQGEETVRKHSCTVKTQVHCSSFDETVDEEHNMILLRAHANDVCGYTLKHADDEFFLLIIVSYNHCVFFFITNPFLCLSKDWQSLLSPQPVPPGLSKGH